jgi:hypothetical protein
MLHARTLATHWTEQEIEQLQADLDDVRATLATVRAMLPAQYSAGFRDGVQAAQPLDAAAPFVVGPDAG